MNTTMYPFPSGWTAPSYSFWSQAWPCDLPWPMKWKLMGVTLGQKREAAGPQKEGSTRQKLWWAWNVSKKLMFDALSRWHLGAVCYWILNLTIPTETGMIANEWQSRWISWLKCAANKKNLTSLAHCSGPFTKNDLQLLLQCHFQTFPSCSRAILGMRNALNIFLLLLPPLTDHLLLFPRK